MTDINEDNFDYDTFSKFAFKMLKDGTCSKVECPEYRHYQGPQVYNDRCRECFKDRTG